MDEFELIVEYAAGNQRVLAGGFQSAQQIAHQSRHPVGRRRHVDDFGADHNSNPATAVGAWMLEQAMHQQPVSS